MENKYKVFTQSLIVAFILFSNVSCVPFNKLKYFTDINALEEPVTNPRENKIIMPFDKLYIKVVSIDDKTNQLFNSNDNAIGISSASTIGNLVDASGKINYPFAGAIVVEGLTLGQASKKIEEALNQYVSNVTVSVKFIDNNVTVLGEVQRQGVYGFSQDKINIYEALALGGGLTQYGDRKSVILIRQENGKIMHQRLDLSDSKISNKNYYYILANDVIVVEPIKQVSHNYSNNTISIILNSITSLIAVLIFMGVKF